MAEARRKKKKKWIHFRHNVVWQIGRVVCFFVLKIRCHYHWQKLSRKEYRQALILSNHQTVFDQFFVGITFPRPVYYVASEAIISNGFKGRFVTWCAAPIPIKKAKSDTTAVAGILRVVKEGGSVAIFPEGNQSMAGKTGYMKKTVASLAKRLKIPLILYRLEGGYAQKPRWCDHRRKCSTRGSIARVIEPEELAGMSEDEIYRIIVDTLTLDDHDGGQIVRSRHMAEQLERILYVCPKCGMTSFIGKGNRIKCNTCSLEAEFQPDLSLRAVTGELPYKNECEWFDAQQEYIRKLDREAFLERPAYVETVSLHRVVLYEKTVCVAKQLRISLYSDRLEFATADPEESLSVEIPRVIRFDELESASVQYANTLMLYFDDLRTFRVTGDTHFNAVKYMDFVSHYQKQYLSVLTGLPEYQGENDMEFLGV